MVCGALWGTEACMREGWYKERLLCTPLPHLTSPTMVRGCVPRHSCPTTGALATHHALSHTASAYRFYMPVTSTSSDLTQYAFGGTFSQINAPNLYFSSPCKICLEYAACDVIGGQAHLLWRGAKQGQEGVLTNLQILVKRL